MVIRKNKSGFTLVELLVVIAIISILTIVISSSFSSAQKKARDAKRKAELSSLTKALQMYYNDFGRFPVASMGDLDINAMLNASGEQDFSTSNYTYMKIMPKETKLGMLPYRYVVSAGGKSYNLFANLENTKDSDCKLDAGGNGIFILGGNNYCYGLSSPNVSPGTTTNP